VKHIYVLIFVIIFLIVYYALIIFNHKNRSLKITEYISVRKKPKIISNYETSVNDLLFNLDYPYKLTSNKYFFIKYILSIVFFIISLLNYKSIFVPLLLGIFIYLSPNVLINNFLKSQNVKLIKEIKKINTNLILKLSSYVPQTEAIKFIGSTVQDKRIKKHFSKFAYDYEVLNFNLKKAADKLLLKFKSSELEMFLQVLIQSETEGSIIENLERFNSTLELSYSKYLRSVANKRLTFVVIGTVLMLLNIIIVSMYPIIVQVINNLQIIFS